MNLRKPAAAIMVTLLVAGCTATSSGARHSSPPTVPASSTPARPATLHVQASGNKVCGIVSPGAAAGLLGDAPSRVHATGTSATSRHGDGICNVDGPSGSVSIYTAFGATATGAYASVVTDFVKQLHLTPAGALPTPFVSLSSRLSVADTEVARYTCGSTVAMIEVLVRHGRSVTNAAAALKQFFNLLPAPLAAKNNCLLTSAPYHPTSAGTVRTVAGDGLLSIPGGAAMKATKIPLGRAQAMTTAADGSVYVAVTSLTAKEVADLESIDDIALTGSRSALVHITATGRMRAVPLRDVAAKDHDDSGVGIPDVLLDDLTWHRGQLWAVETAGNGKGQSSLFHIDPATGRSDIIEPDLGRVVANGKSASMSADNSVLANRWNNADWSAVSFDGNDPVLLDVTHRTVWHVTLEHNRAIASPFGLAFATARPTTLSSRVPTLARQGAFFPNARGYRGAPLRPAVGLPGGNFAARTADGRLAIVHSDGSAGAHTEHTVAASTTSFLSHPQTAGEPLLLSNGRGMVRFDQSTLKSRNVYVGAPRARYSAPLVRVGTRYSTDPLNVDALNTGGSAGPVAWQHGTALLAVTSGTYRLLRLTAT